MERRGHERAPRAAASESEPQSPTPTPTPTQQPQMAGAGLLMLLQASSRLVTLLMAHIQVRLAAAEAFGAAHIHLELLLGTILMFSREGVRNALVRQAPRAERKASSKEESQDAGEAREQAIANVALLPIPAGIITALVLVLVYARHLAPVSLVAHPHFGSACAAFAAGAVLEVLAEPLFTHSLRRVRLGPRVAAEGLGVIAKSASTLGMMLWLQRQANSNNNTARESILPFAIGQLCYGSAFLGVFFAHSIRELGAATTIRTYLPHRPRSASAKGNAGTVPEPWLDQTSVRLSLSMTRQNIVKHLLGEGDKFAVARLASLSEQGAYALASNYASLVARLVLQPLEESARLTFASTLGASSTEKNGSEGREGSENNDESSRAAATTARSLLHTLLSFYALMACFLFIFCRTSITTPLLLLVAGPRWALHTSAPSILAAYGAFYLPVMAFNGLLEGYVQACASPQQLARYDGVLLCASALFVATLGAFHALDRTLRGILAPEVALVIASTVSTATRATYCFRFTGLQVSAEQTRRTRRRRRRQDSSLFSIRGVFPGKTVMIFLFTTLCSTYACNSRLSAEIWHLPWTTAAYTALLRNVFLVLLALIGVFSNKSERNTVKGALTAIRGR